MLWGEEVGKLNWDERGRRAVFNYNPDFVKKGIDIAPLTASIKGAAGKGFPVVGNREKLYQGLPPFLADSLPDYWGNKVFAHWAAQNHIPKQTEDGFKVSDVRVEENSLHDFRIEACINGKWQKYIAGRRSAV